MPKRKKGKKRKWIIAIIVIAGIFLATTFPITSYSKHIELSGITAYRDYFSIYPARNQMKITITYTLTGYVNITIIDPNNKTVYTTAISDNAENKQLTETANVNTWGQYTILIITLGGFKGDIKITTYNTVLKPLA